MALAETAKLVVDLSLKGNFASQLKASERSLTGLASRITSVQGRFSKAGQQIATGVRTTAVIAVAAVGALGPLLVRIAKEGQNAADVETIFAKAVANSGKVSLANVAALRAQEEALLRLGGVDDELIKTEQTRLIQMGLTGDQILKLTPLVLDFAKATGIDLLTATKLAGKAVQGNTGALSRYGVQIDKAKAKVDPFAATVDALNHKFGGTTAALSGSLNNKLAVLREELANVREEAGQRLLPVMTRLVDIVGSRIVPAFGKFLDAILPRAIAGLNKLGDALESGAGAQTFTRIIDTIQAVLPAIEQGARITGQVISTAVHLFESLPPEIQSLAIAGLAINKLTGGLVTNLAGGLISAVLKQLVSGVVNVNGAVVNVNGLAGLPGVAGAAAGAEGAAAAGAAGLGLGTIAAGIAAGTAISALGIMGLGWLITATSSPAQLAQAAKNVNSDQRNKRSLGGVSGNQTEKLLTDFSGLMNANAREDRNALHADLGALGGKISDDLHGVTDLQRGVWAEFNGELKKLVAARKPEDIQKAAKAIADRIAEKNQGSLASTLAVEKAIKEQLKNTHDPATQRVLRAALDRVEAKIPGRRYVERQITEAKKVAASTQSAKRKIDDLKVIERNLLTHGDKHAASQIANLIAIARNTLLMKNALGGILNLGNNPGKNKDDRSRPGSGTTGAGGSKPTVADANAREDRNTLTAIARFASAGAAPKTTPTTQQGGLFVPTVKLDPSQVLDLRNGAGTTLRQVTADFRAFANSTSREDRDALHADLGSLGGKITDDLASFAGREFAIEARILGSHESANRKIAELKKVEQALKDHGLPHAAALIGARIAEAKRAQTYAQRATTEAIKDKDLSVRVGVTVPVTTYVSVRDVVKTVTKAGRFGVSVT